MTKNRKTLSLLLCAALMTASLFGLLFSMQAKASSDGPTTVSYTVGENGVYVTDDFDNAITYKSKTDATVIADNASTYGKTLHEMLSVKLSESIDISAANRVWDGFLINVKFSGSFRFYMWLGEAKTDGSVVISRNYNGATVRYEKFLDNQGNDLSAQETGVLTKTGYCTSTSALSGTWVYNFSDIIVNRNGIIDELLFGVRMNDASFFGQGYEINSISVYKAGATAADYTVKTLFNAADLTITTDANDTTADINLADHKNGKTVNTSRTPTNNTGTFIDATTYATVVETSESNVSLSVPTGVVTVNYLDEDGEPLQNATSVTYRKGKTYTVTTPAIGNYIYKESDVALTGTVNGDITVNLTYAVAGVKVTVNYLDGSGNPISDSTNRSYIEGSTYTVETPSFPGYEYLSSDVALTGTVNSDITINLTYKSVAQYTLTVKYQDGDGAIIKDDDTATYNDGATYTVSIPEIEHYAFVSADKGLTGNITENTTVILTFGIDSKNPPRTLTDVNYTVNDGGLQITDGLVGGVVVKTKSNFSTIADSADTYGKTILGTVKINFSEKIDAVDEWDGLIIRMKNTSVKDLKFNAYLLSDGQLGRNYISSTARSEVFVNSNGVNLGASDLGIKYASSYPTISSYADGTWNYKFSDLQTATASAMTNVEAMVFGLRMTTTEFADCGLVIGSIAVYKEDQTSPTGYTVKTLFNSKDLVISDETGYSKADVNVTDTDLGKLVTTEVAAINNTGLFVADEYYDTLHTTIISALKIEIQGCTVTYNYVDEYGDSISVSTSQNIIKGDSYQVEPITIIGYEFVSADKPMSGTVDTDLTINLTYKLKEYTLTVKFVDEQGNELKSDYVTTVKYGDWVVIDAEKDQNYMVGGYVFKSIDDAAKFTVYSDETRTIVFEKAPASAGGCGGKIAADFGVVLTVLVFFVVTVITVRKIKKEN